jgi:UDP-N-acetylmuramoyl-tripeptide--D-alanyl-D-alanine ligase
VTPPHSEGNAGRIPTGGAFDTVSAVRWRASEVASAVGGQLVGPDLVVEGASIDSRSIRPGQLFVPIVDARDGHDFIDAAREAGAPAHLTSRPDRTAPEPAIVVDDTARALLDLGRLARTALPERVVGITGSVGKTTTKDLLAAILGERFATTASERSFNNELGVPLTLANAPTGTEAAVVEMGARGAGHIALLCSVATPTIGVVTVVAGAHLEVFGTLDDVARAKGELIEALPAHGTAVLNADDARVAGMAARASATVRTFGERAGDVRAEHVTVDDELHPSFRLVTGEGAADVRLVVRGRHQVTNALAAATAALAAGCTLDDVAAGLGTAHLSGLRMDLQRAASGALILNDSYNANPTSTAAALDALAALPARRRIAVLGVMAELGEDSAAGHREVAARASELGIEVRSVAAPDYGVEDAPDIATVVDQLGRLGEGDAVLVKGSRVAGLEALAEALLSR